MAEPDFDIDPMMGRKVKDKITGFTGIVTGKLDTLYGCRQFVITAPVDEKGKAVDNKAVIDEGRVKVLGRGIRPKAVKAKSGKKGADTVPTEIGNTI